MNYTHISFYRNIISISFLLSTAILANVSIEKIEPNGLILKHMGEVHTYEKSINILFATPHDEYFQQQTFIENCIEKLKELRNISTIKNEFDSILSEFYILSKTINNMNNIIETKHNRIKRFTLLPWVGKAYEVLFGLTSVYTIEKIQNQITESDDRIASISSGLFNHSEYTMEIIDTIQEKNNDSESRILNIAHKLNEIINQIEDQIYNEEKEAKISSLIQLLTLAIIRYRDFQNKILSHILNRDVTSIDPEIISFSSFQSVIKNIDSRINQSDLFGWSSFNDIELMSWYKLMAMDISIENNQIITKINIPLISIERKEIFETIPAPSLQNNELYYIKPEAPFFITNKQRNEIGYLSLSDFRKCWKKSEKYFVCPRTFPFFSETKENHFCELSILQNTKETSENCVTFPLIAKDLFIRLNDENEYYFVILKPLKFNIDCNGEISHKWINKTGIISINNGCLMYNDAVQIAAQTIINIRKQNNYIISNFTQSIPKNKTIIYKYEVNTNDLAVLNKNFENIKIKIKQNLKNSVFNSKAIDIINFIRNMEFDLFYIFGIAIIIIIICIKCRA